MYVDLITHKKWFLGELKDIRKVAGYFDIAIKSDKPVKKELIDVLAVLSI